MTVINIEPLVYLLLFFCVICAVACCYVLHLLDVQRALREAMHEQEQEIENLRCENDALRTACREWAEDFEKLDAREARRAHRERLRGENAAREQGVSTVKFSGFPPSSLN
jgi:cell division protein FtsB